MTATKRLAKIGKYPAIGDAIEIRDRWSHRIVIAHAKIVGATATHVAVESRLVTIDDAPPFQYQIDRATWIRKCVHPHTVLGEETAT